MNKITFSLQPGKQGPVVADLQDGLQLFIDRRVILAGNKKVRRELPPSCSANAQKKHTKMPPANW